MLHSVPMPARIFGLAGLIPFWTLALLVFLGDASMRASTLAVLIAYGAVILSFLGGVHWGIAVRAPTQAGWKRLGWGVTPSLIGWVAVLMPASAGLCTLIVCLLFSAWVDQRMFPNSDDAWYRRLRIVLSSGAALALLLALAGTVTWGGA